MADLTSINFKTMDYSYRGQPCVFLRTDETQLFLNMDYSYRGQPFVMFFGSSVVQNIKKVNTASWWSNVKKFGGKLIADIEKINQTEP